MTNDVNIMLEKIADSIVNNYTLSEENDLGLFTGDTGVIIFLAYYCKYNPNTKYKKKLSQLLQLCCHRISTSICSPTYCSGIVGVLLAFEHLKQKSFIDIDLSDIISNYKNYLIKQMLYFQYYGNNDFLHGALGIAFYLAKTYDDNIIEQYVNLLEQSGHTDDDSIKWLSLFSNEKSAYNISLSHGISSIIIFLCFCAKKSSCPSKCKILLEKSIHYILKQEIDVHKYHCFFPSISIEEEHQMFPSRLGWCYGDLGIALALWNAGKVLDDSFLRNKAMEVIDYSTTRLDLKNNMVFDACLCHGTAGIAQIYRRMYYETGKELYLTTSHYWILETLKMSKWQEGSAGYRFYCGHIENEHKWINQYSFINGIAGIGLALLSAINNEDYSGWDCFLLLSDFI